MSLLPVIAPVAAPAATPTKVGGYGSFVSDDGTKPGHSCSFWVKAFDFTPNSNEYGACKGYGWFFDRTARMWVTLKVTSWKWGWSAGVPPKQDVLLRGTAKFFEGWSYVSKEFEIRLFFEGAEPTVGFWDFEDPQYWVRGHLTFGQILISYPPP